MEKLRVLIVDDSPFSQRMIKDALVNSRYEVCATAGTGSEGIEQYRTCHPDVVTMDLTLPDMDGLECCREILTINPHAQIVILSAMKDEAIINRGTAIGVRVFLQKPVKAQELVGALTRVVSEKEEAAEFTHQLTEFFSGAFEQNLLDMAGLKSTIDVQEDDGTKFVSHGLAIIIGLTGTRQGRLVVDLSTDVAVRFARKIMGSVSVSDEDLLNSIAEFANIVAGHGVSQINNVFKDKDIEVRLTPPSILLGESLSIINPKMVSSTFTAATEIGLVYMNVGFVGGK